MSTSNVGISGFAAYLPPYTVRLADWCDWTGDAWEKVKAVIGTTFRMSGPNENAYTMAATAVLRLIRQYNVDPRSIGYLALGTESSTDNSAGAIIVKGMVNDALAEHRLPQLSRACEVPEFKHACLGGIYALKAAFRYLAVDGRGRKAIVVCSDIAEYQRASSGEPTQGAGAVALLVEENPRLLDVELGVSGSSSAYRGVDFRKPFQRFAEQAIGRFAQLKDFPVFNGKYSTTCYIDAVLGAMKDLFPRLTSAPSSFLKEVKAVFLHRPYQRMAEMGLAVSYLLALAAGGAADRAELANYAKSSGVDGDALAQELTSQPALYDLVRQQDINAEIYPLATQAARLLRQLPVFGDLMTKLGAKRMGEVGNLYTASLPAWMAAGFEEASLNSVPLAGERVLTVGYGSGDAAEVIPMQVVRGWEAAADKIQFSAALSNARILDRGEYEMLHDRSDLPNRRDAAGVFYIDHIGDRSNHFDDQGVEYYRYQV